MRFTLGEVIKIVSTALGGAATALGVAYAFLSPILAEAQDIRERVTKMETTAREHRARDCHAGTCATVHDLAVEQSAMKARQELLLEGVSELKALMLEDLRRERIRQ